MRVEPDLESLKDIDLYIRQLNLALVCLLERSFEGGAEEIRVEAQQVLM